MEADRSERDAGNLTRRRYLRGIGLAALGTGAASLLFTAGELGTLTGATDPSDLLIYGQKAEAKTDRAGR